MLHSQHLGYRMNILYLTYDGLNDPLGQSQILPYLVGLTECGHEITVVSFEKVRDFGIGVQSSKLNVIPLKYHKSPPVLSTLYDIFLLKQEVKKLIKSRQIDIIHCRSYITSLVGLWAKRKYGVKFIFDMRGFWADERVEGGLWNLRNPVFNAIYKYFKKKEKEFLLESDVTISLTNNAKEEIEDNIILNQQISKSTTSPGLLTNWQPHIEVIPTCVDLELFNPDTITKAETEQLKGNLGILPEDFVLLYLGSLGTWYMLEEMLDFYKELKVKRQRVKGQTKFLFVTREQDELKEIVGMKNKDAFDVIITSCQRPEVPKYISICDASIFFIIPTYSKKASAATKMGEIMAMGKPIITNTGWGDVDVLVYEKKGVLVQDLSSEGYQKSISQYLNTSYDPSIIRSYAEAHFSLQKGVEVYDKLYKQLASLK